MILFVEKWGKKSEKFCQEISPFSPRNRQFTVSHFLPEARSLGFFLHADCKCNIEVNLSFVQNTGDISPETCKSCKQTYGLRTGLFT